MERRETYDPEDIESLLSERAFDELLEEERAFVLRHLSGREEYEAMRALLLQVRRDERPEALLEMDDAVRERVLNTYRNERRPKWGFSLNSVLAAFWPAEATGFWRPAMALGALALVVVLAVGLWQRLSTQPDQLAELHEPQPPAPGGSADRGPSDKPEGNGAGAATLEGEGTETTSTATGSVAAVVPPTSEALAEHVAVVTAEPREAVADSHAINSLSATRTDDEVAVETGETAMDIAQVKEYAVPRTVEAQELLSNASVTNASAESVKKVSSKAKYRSAEQERKPSATSLADTPQLVSALAAAW